MRMPLPVFERECEDIADMRKAIGDGLEKGECFIKESGTALRFLTAFFAVAPPAGTVTCIKCSGRLAQRPLDGLIDALVELGMSRPKIEMKGGVKSIFIPASPLHGGRIKVSSSLTSQFVSALLLIAPSLSGSLRLEGNYESLPYVRMTAALMRRCGAKVHVTTDFIEVANLPYRNLDAAENVEADWSAASFFYEYVALNGEAPLLLKNLRSHESLQGDARWLPRLFYDLGVTTDDEGEGTLIDRFPSRTVYSRYDLSSCPDLVMPYIVTCCFAGTNFRLRNIGTLRHKESDRISAMVTAMRGMGFVLREEGEKENPVLVWSGERCEPLPLGSRLEDASDHRIAMAIEAAARGYHAAHPECVDKSFPGFYDELKKLTEKR